MFGFFKNRNKDKKSSGKAKDSAKRSDQIKEKEVKEEKGKGKSSAVPKFSKGKEPKVKLEVQLRQPPKSQRKDDRLSSGSLPREIPSEKPDLIQSTETKSLRAISLQPLSASERTPVSPFGPNSSDVPTDTDREESPLFEDAVDSKELLLQQQESGLCRSDSTMGGYLSADCEAPSPEQNTGANVEHEKPQFQPEPNIDAGSLSEGVRNSGEDLQLEIKSIVEDVKTEQLQDSESEVSAVSHELTITLNASAKEKLKQGKIETRERPPEIQKQQKPAQSIRSPSSSKDTASTRKEVRKDVKKTSSPMPTDKPKDITIKIRPKPMSRTPEPRENRNIPSPSGSKETKVQKRPKPRTKATRPRSHPSEYRPVSPASPSPQRLGQRTRRGHDGVSLSSALHPPAKTLTDKATLTEPKKTISKEEKVCQTPTRVLCDIPCQTIHCDLCNSACQTDREQQSHNSCQTEEQERSHNTCQTDVEETCHNTCQTEMCEQSHNACQTDVNDQCHNICQTDSCHQAHNFTQTEIYSRISRTSQTMIPERIQMCCQTEPQNQVHRSIQTSVADSKSTNDACINTVEKAKDLVHNNQLRKELQNKETQFQEQIKKIQNELKHKEKELEGQKEKVETLRQQKQEIVRQELLYQQQLRQAKAELKNSETQVRQEKRDIEALQKQKEDVEKKMESLRVQLKSAQTDVNTMTTRVVSLEKDVTNFKQHTTDLEKQLSSKKDEMSSMTSTVLTTDRQRQKLEDELKDVQTKIKKSHEEREKLKKQTEEMLQEREEELGLMQEALEEALQEKDELTKRFEKFRTVNSCREQQLLDDFEWKLRELEQSNKKKLKEQEIAYEEKIKTIKEAMKMELDRETGEAEQKKTPDEELHKGSYKKQIETKEEIEEKLLQLKNQLNSEWEMRLKDERNRLEALHAEDKKNALEALIEEKKKEFTAKELDWESKEKELIEKIDDLSEQEKSLMAQIEALKPAADEEVYQLKMQLNKLKEEHNEQLTKLNETQLQQMTATEKHEQEETTPVEEHNHEFTQVLDKLRHSLTSEHGVMLDYLQSTHNGELTAINKQLAQALVHANSLRDQLKEKHKQTENVLKLKEQEMETLRSQVTQLNSIVNNISGDETSKWPQNFCCHGNKHGCCGFPPDPGTLSTPAAGSEEVSESGYVNNNSDMTGSDEEDTYPSHEAGGEESEESEEDSDSDSSGTESSSTESSQHSKHGS